MLLLCYFKVLLLLLLHAVDTNGQPHEVKEHSAANLMRQAAEVSVFCNATCSYNNHACLAAQIHLRQLSSLSSSICLDQIHVDGSRRPPHHSCLVELCRIAVQLQQLSPAMVVPSRRASSRLCDCSSYSA